MAQPASDIFAHGFGRLFKEHYEELSVGSGISDDVIREREARTAMSQQELLSAGFSKRQARAPGLVLPIHTLTGETTICYKPDHPREEIGPNGKVHVIKYEIPMGGSNRIDCPPRCREQLPDPSIPLAFTEGIKKADAGATHGLCVVALLGVWNWRGRNDYGGSEPIPDLEYIPVKDRDVFLVFDSDTAGNPQVAEARRCLAIYLKGRGARVRYLEIPSRADGSKQGLDDYLLHHTTAELMALACEANEHTPRKRQAEQLLDVAEDLELFHNLEGDPYATGEVAGHRETWQLRSKGFKQWLSYRYYTLTGKMPSTQALQDALSVLAGKALFDGKEHPVFVRIAEHKGKYYLDLCNSEWEAVEITPDGWRVISNPPVKFRRARGMQALPTPVRGGSVRELHRFVNVGSEADWVLVLAWLIAALRPTGPYPVLMLHGEQGSAKSTLLRILRALIDPNSASLRAEPRDERDLVIAALNGRVLSLDNLSRIAAWLSDALCRLATGGGFATRELYSDSDEMLFDGQRPAMVNGITELATRADLLDRSIVLYLPAIPEDQRRTESEVLRDFESAMPRIFGALLDAVSCALRRVGSIKLDQMPRMADFAIWATAAEPALELEEGTFMAAYRGNRRDANSLALESSPIPQSVQAFLEGRGRWEGTATELLKELDGRASEGTRRLQSWPSTPRALSNTLRRIVPNLRAVGIDVSFDHRAHGGRRLIRLERAGNPSSPSSPDASNPSNRADSGGDDGVTQDRHGDDTVTQATPHIVTEKQQQAREVGPGGDDGDDGKHHHSDQGYDALNAQVAALLKSEEVIDG